MNLPGSGWRPKVVPERIEWMDDAALCARYPYLAEGVYKRGFCTKTGGRAGGELHSDATNMFPLHYIVKSQHSGVDIASLATIRGPLQMGPQVYQLSTIQVC